MQEAKQLNLYKRDEILESEEIEAENGSDVIDNETLAKILKEKVPGKELPISKFDGIMIIYNSISKNKIELYAPASLKLFAKALKDLDYAYDGNELEKQLKIREELIKKEITRKYKALEKENARRVLPKGDRD
jgi:hypothetical protein